MKMNFTHLDGVAKKPFAQRAKLILAMSLSISTVFALQAPAAHALLQQDPLVITSTSGSLGAPLVLTYSGGSGTGDHYFFIMERNCDVTRGANGEWLLTLIELNRSGLPVCDEVVVGKNGDEIYDGARSVPIAITFTDGHGVKPQLPTVLTTLIDKVGQPLPMTYSSVSTLVTARSEKASSVRRNTR
jgi:hypothetical protein